MGAGGRLSMLMVGLVVCCMSFAIDAKTLFGRHDDERPPALDELLVAAVNDSGEFSFFYDLNHHLLKTEYDVLLTMEEYQQLMSPVVREKRAAGVYPSQNHKRWTNNVMYYEIDPRFSNADKDEIQRAFIEWSHFTCLKFEENPSSQNRIVLQDAGGCYSYVGMQASPQPMGLGNGCRYKRIVLHEVGHAIGLHHEQTRPDRDDHVTIRFENIRDSMEYNFDKYTWGYIMDLGIPYDYYSIMHYSNRAFSENGQISIETKDPEFKHVIGTVDGLSFLDIKTVNIMYKCGAENGCTKKDSECPEGGFVGKDCTCWCPGNPAKHCDSKDDEEKGVLDQTCMDTKPYTCTLYASKGYCTQYKSYMKTNCPKSCGLC